MEKILDFDELLFSRGHRFGIYDITKVLPGKSFGEVLDDYLLDRSRNFYKEGVPRYVCAVDLGHWNSFRRNIVSRQAAAEFTIVPFMRDSEIVYEEVNASNYRREPSVLEVESDPVYSYDDLMDKGEWGVEAFLSICSYSNIWREDIHLIKNGQGYFEYVKKPVDNRPIAYRIVPRFNSFLRDLKLKANELGGDIELDEGVKKFVTPEGILLDGKIIYQEDIDEGRVRPPNF